MPKKKSPLESAGRRKRAYELEGLPIGGYPMDPMRQIEDQALRDLSNEYRQLRIEEMIAKKRGQLEKSEPSSNISMQKQNLDMIKTMMEIAKMNQPKEGKDNTLEYVKMFKDLMLESAKLRGGGGQSFFESMLIDPNLYQRTQDLFRQGQAGDANQFSLEIEKLRGERMMESKKFDLEIKREELKREMDMQKLNMVLGSLSPIVALGAGKLEQQVQQRGRDLGRPHNPINPNPTGEMSEVRIQCNCGFNSPMFFAGDPPSQVSCPGCGAILNIGKEGEEEGSQDWTQKSQSY